MNLSQLFLEVAAWLHLCQLPGVIFLSRHVVDLRADLPKLHPLTRAIFVVIGVSVVSLLVFLGVAMGSYADDVLASEFGLLLCLALGIFWFVRLAVQFWYYSSSLWPLHRSGVLAHYALLAIFALQTAGYLAAWTLTLAGHNSYAVVRT